MSERCVLLRTGVGSERHPCRVFFMEDVMPKIGEVCTFIASDKSDEHNCHADHPCIVTRAWSDHCVNVKVFFDCGPVEDRASVPYRNGQCG